MPRPSQTFLAALAVMLALVLLATAAGPAAAQEAKKKPNIILILNDDFGYGDAGVYGGGPAVACPPLISTVWRMRA